MITAAALAYRKAWTVVAWTYDADVHCWDCTESRFPAGFDWSDPSETVTDSEGNVPCPVFASDYEGGDVCGDCLSPIE
jgi:hypothetical protein